MWFYYSLRFDWMDNEFIFPQVFLFLSPVMVIVILLEFDFTLSSFFFRSLSSYLHLWLVWFHWSLTGQQFIFPQVFVFLISYLLLWLLWLFHWNLTEQQFMFAQVFIFLSPVMVIMISLEFGSCFLRFLSSYLQLWLLLLFHWGLTGQQVHVTVSSGFCLLISSYGYCDFPFFTGVWLDSKFMLAQVFVF